mmetsp:Transcript_30548/g.98773  ORF Transcript_30548/g.98773 Transcript_30548/m.98773 type:complete len:217 (+) Transcript_30548:643-1293(+)
MLLARGKLESAVLLQAPQMAIECHVEIGRQVGRVIADQHASRQEPILPGGVPVIVARLGDVHPDVAALELILRANLCAQTTRVVQKRQAAGQVLTHIAAQHRLEQVSETASRLHPSEHGLGVAHRNPAPPLDQRAAAGSIQWWEAAKLAGAEGWPRYPHRIPQRHKHTGHIPEIVLVDEIDLGRIAPRMAAEDLVPGHGTWKRHCRCCVRCSELQR